MLQNQKIIIEAKSVVNETPIMGFRALIETNNPNEVTLLPWQINKEACKEYREIVREDQKEFEESVYKIQEKVLLNV